MPTAQKNIYIVHTGAQTPVGEDAILTAANARGEIYRISAADNIRDESWEKVKVSYARHINYYLPNEDRFSELGKNALREVLTFFEKKCPQEKTLPVLIGLPKHRPGLSRSLEENLKDELIDYNNHFKTTCQIRFLRGGHSSGIMALRKGFNSLQAEGFDFFIIGGVESYLDFSTIKWLEKKSLLKNSLHGGMIPGEAAGFCLLANDEGIQKYGLKPLAKIKSFGIAEEENDYDSHKESTGKGLGKAILEAAEPILGKSKIHQFYATLNGVSYDADEYGNALSQIGPLFNDIKAPQIFSKHWGDIGAATVPVYLSMITFHRTIKEAEGPYTLLFTGSFESQRSAVLLEYLT